MSDGNAFVLIPAYKPQVSLVHLVDELLAAGMDDIVVVDDGGGEKFAPVFDRLREKDGVVVLTHEVNQGKGAALKTGLAYCYHQRPECSTVVTADADGQHTADDISAVGAFSLAHPDALTLGVRQFDEMIPKSRFGNTVTHWVLQIFYGLKITDTQTGLRGIPRSFIPACLEIPYTAYEYETEMLLITKGERVQIVELAIETLYFDDNKGSHFNILVDSSKIYFVIFRYTLASLAAALVDTGLFAILFALIGQVGWSIAGARLVSLLVNYFLLQYVVFYSRRRPGVTFPRYLALVVFSGVLATVLIDWLSQQLGWDVIVAKIVVEVTIYFFNFLMNTLWVFVGRRRKQPAAG